MNDAIVFGIAIVGILGVGVALGMLLAPRLTRLAERDDEEPGDDQRD